MNAGKGILSIAVTLLVVSIATSLEAQWLPQPPTGSGPIYYNGGFLGLGTSTPDEMLTMFSSLDARTTLKIQNTNGTGQSANASVKTFADIASAIYASQGSGRTTAFRYGLPMGGWNEVSGITGNGLMLGTLNSAPVLFGTNNLEAMRIDATGNVGIGTTSIVSGNKLQVNGNAILSGSNRQLTLGNGQGIRDPGGPDLQVFQSPSFAGNITFWTGGTSSAERVRIENSGNVGIGTTTPGQKLVVAGNAQLSTGGSIYGNTTNQALTLNSSSGSKLSYDGSNYVLVGGNIITFGNNPGEAMRLYNGKLGIGVAPGMPSSSLHVAGDLRLGSNGTNTDLTIFTDTPATLAGTAYTEINSVTPVTVPPSGQTTRTALHLKNATAAGQGTNQMDLIVDGTISGASVIGAMYQDVAEWVRSGKELEPATVVVLDRGHDDQVVPSNTAYDTTVAGVVSARPGVILGVGAPGKEKIATTGRVKVKVDATRAPISIGDLLVTSDLVGVAMKSQPIDVAGVKIHRPGTVIGKALQALPSGRGEILVLLSLQ